MRTRRRSGCRAHGRVCRRSPVKTARARQRPKLPHSSNQERSIPTARCMSRRAGAPARGLRLHRACWLRRSPRRPGASAREARPHGSGDARPAARDRCGCASNDATPPRGARPLDEATLAPVPYAARSWSWIDDRTLTVTRRETSASTRERRFAQRTWSSPSPPSSRPWSDRGMRAWWT